MKIIGWLVLTFLCGQMLGCAASPKLEKDTEGGGGVTRTGRLPIGESEEAEDSRPGDFDLRVVKHSFPDHAPVYDIIVVDHTSGGPLNILNKDSLHFHIAGRMESLSTKSSPVNIKDTAMQVITYTSVPVSLLQEIVMNQTYVRVLGRNGTSSGLLSKAGKAAILKLIEN
jgi:hypothetical protein